MTDLLFKVKKLLFLLFFNFISGFISAQPDTITRYKNSELIHFIDGEIASPTQSSGLDNGKKLFKTIIIILSIVALIIILAIIWHQMSLRKEK